MPDDEYIRVKDGYAEIRMKLTSGRPSYSGKSLVVASTNGFVRIDENYMISLNVIKKH